MKKNKTRTPEEEQKFKEIDGEFYCSAALDTNTNFKRVNLKMSNKSQVNFLVKLFLVPVVGFGVFVGVMNMPTETHNATVVTQKATQKKSEIPELPDWAMSREPQPWSKPASDYNNTSNTTSYSYSTSKPQTRGEKLADKMQKDFAIARAMGASEEEAAEASLLINNREIIDYRYDQMFPDYSY